MEPNLEEKIKIESDTFALRRDYKYALENVTRIKAETAEIINVKEKVTKEVSEKQQALTDLLNQLAQEKNDWAQFRHSQLLEIQDKESAAQNILNRKSELNAQEESIRKFTETNTQALNTNLQLELKLKGDQTALEVKQREIDEEWKKVGVERQRINKDLMRIREKLSVSLQDIISLI